MLAEHQVAHGLCFSMKLTANEAGLQEADFQNYFGRWPVLRHPWNLVRFDECQFRAGGMGESFLVANYVLDELHLTCRKPHALAGASHDHERIGAAVETSEFLSLFGLCLKSIVGSCECTS